MREVHRAVDRIDDPAQAARRRARVLTTLLAEHRHARRGLGQRGANPVLRAHVPLGHEIARVALVANVGRTRAREQLGRRARRVVRRREQLADVSRSPRARHYRSKRIATRPAAVGCENVSLAATALLAVVRSTTRKPNFAAKKSLAVSVSR